MPDAEMPDSEASAATTAAADALDPQRPRPGPGADPPATPATPTPRPTPGTDRPDTADNADDTPHGDDPGRSPAPAKSRAGRNLPVAIAVGVGLAALVVASLFLYRPSFAYLVGAAVLYGCWELSRALRTADIRITLVPVLVGAVVILLAAWTRGPSGLVLAVLVTLVAVLVWRIGDGAAGYFRDATASAFVLWYLPTLAAFAVLLVRPDDGAARVVAFVATVVCSDTGGYASGVLFGRHPLAPVVSKAKTWEGFAGSVLACSTIGILLFALTFHQAWWKGLLFGLAIVATATLGDLGESMIKRDLEIKDMGSLLPGHGGLMDRLDSLLPCAAVAYLVLSALAPV